MISAIARARIILAIVSVIPLAMLPMPRAFAAGSNMPWEQPLQQILQSIEGPVSKIIAVIIIIVTGLTLAFGHAAGGFRRLIQIVFGLSIVQSGRIPFMAGAAVNTENWLAGLRQVGVMRPRFWPRPVAPGRRTAIAFTRDYILFLRKFAGEAVESWMSFEDAYDKSDWSLYRGGRPSTRAIVATRTGCSLKWRTRFAGSGAIVRQMK